MNNKDNYKNAIDQIHASEKLKEKAFEKFLQEENAKESKEIDELVSFTYGKKQREDQ